MSEVFVEGAEGTAVQRLLGRDAECAQTGSAEGVRSLLQKGRGLGGVGARGGEVAAAQFGDGEVDQDHDALSARGRGGVVERGGQRVPGAVVVTGLQQDMAGGGGGLVTLADPDPMAEGMTGRR